MKLELKLPKWAEWLTIEALGSCVTLWVFKPVKCQGGTVWGSPDYVTELIAEIPEDIIDPPPEYIDDDSMNNRWKIEPDGTLKHMPWVEGE